MDDESNLHIKPLRLEGLPETLRAALKAARLERGWSQLEMGRRIGLPQAHVSGIETGKTIPRFDTLLELVRVLDFDLILVPRTLVPAVQALIRDGQRPDAAARPIYDFGEGEGGEEKRDEP